MTISGPQPILTNNLTTGQDLNLHPFQRVTAEVLRVTNVTAILSIDGYPVVASLSSPQQAAELSAQRIARFIVEQVDDQKLVLKLVPDKSSPQSGTIVVPVSDLATRLLNQLSMPVNANNLMLIRAALNQHLIVSTDLMKELKDVLSKLEDWGQPEANTAAAIKTAGLPLSPGSIALAGRSNALLGSTFADLISFIRQFVKGKNIPAELLQRIQVNSQMLKELVPNSGHSINQLAGEIKDYVKFFGRSVENLLKYVMENPDLPFPEKSLLSLTRLQHFLHQSGETEFSTKINELLENARQSQFYNLKPDSPSQGEWIKLGFPINMPALSSENELFPARFRISRKSTPDGTVDPNSTHLIIQVDLQEKDTIQVDLTLVDRQARVKVTTPKPELSRSAEDELPSLETRLQQLGYMLNESHVIVDTPHPFEGPNLSPVESPARAAINIKV